MQTAVFTSGSNDDLKLLIELAKKMGITAKLLSESEIEEISLYNAIKKGRTGISIPTDSYIKKLRK